MNLSISTLAVLLPLVASTLHRKQPVNNNNNNISSEAEWNKKDLALQVKELRQMESSQGFFSSPVNMERILLKDEYERAGRFADSRLLAQKLSPLLMRLRCTG